MIRRALTAAIVLGLLGLLIMLIPKWLTGLEKEAPATARSHKMSDEVLVDSFLEETIPVIGAAQLLARDEKGGVVRSTWQLDYGTSAKDFSSTLQRRAAD